MSEKDAIVLNRDELQALITAGVTEAFVRLGVQADDPIEMQKDFQHLRAWRQSMTSIQNKTVVALVLTGVSGAIAMMALGIKHWIFEWISMIR